MAADKEFNQPTHEYHVTEEFSLPEEVQREPSEFNADTSAYDAQVVEAVREKKKTTRKRTMLLQFAAAMTAVIIAKDSFLVDLLGNDIFNGDVAVPDKQEEEIIYPIRDNTSKVAAHVRLLPDGGSFLLESKGVNTIYSAREIAADRGYDPNSMEVEKVEYTYDMTIDGVDYYVHHAYINFYKDGYVKPHEEQLEEADSAFPQLGNLYPGGAVEGYGALHEEYVKLESINFPDKAYWAYAGEAYGRALDTEVLASMGARYDYNSNTLYLNNFKGAGLNINWMGNGFKLVVTGNCELDYILAWGFGWGGSMTTTGDGTLTVNRNMDRAEYGIRLQAEGSQTCLMIDGSVTVDAYGNGGAVRIEDSTMEKSIYYLKPLKLGGAQRKFLKAGADTYSAQITDKDGKILTHVLFSK